MGAAALLTTAPLLGPLAQIWLLARKSKEEIEETVRVKEPLQVFSPPIQLEPHRLKGCQYQEGRYAARSGLSSYCLFCDAHKPRQQSCA